jgi:hypothetical protein
MANLNVWSRWINATDTTGSLTWRTSFLGSTWRCIRRRPEHLTLFPSKTTMKLTNLKHSTYRMLGIKKNKQSPMYNPYEPYSAHPKRTAPLIGIPHPKPASQTPKPITSFMDLTPELRQQIYKHHLQRPSLPTRYVWPNDGKATMSSGRCAARRRACTRADCDGRSFGRFRTAITTTAGIPSSITDPDATAMRRSPATRIPISTKCFPCRLAQRAEDPYRLCERIGGLADWAEVHGGGPEGTIRR